MSSDPANSISKPAVDAENASTKESQKAVDEKKDVINEEDMDPIELAKIRTAESKGLDTLEYPTKWKLGLITIALCLSVFCMALDNTILAVAIPKITDEFKSLSDVGWYGSAYLLTTCSLQLFFGKLYTFYSIKWVYLAAIFIFEVGSLICGVAPNSVALIVGRAIAGVGAAGVFSGAILIVSYAVPLHQRPTYTGLIGGMYGIASVAGPLLGGVFTDEVTWRWCFYINLPIGGITIAFILFFYQSPDAAVTVEAGWKEKMKRLDFPGMGVFIPCIICLLLALQWGGSTYEWGNGRIIALFVLFGVLIIVFVFVQRWRGDDATVPPRVFLNRNVWGSSIFGASLGAAFFVLIYWIPIWFQAIKGVSAVQSGVDNLPMVLGVVIISIISGGAVTALGYYTPFIYASVVLMSIGAGMITTFKVDTNSSHWIGYQALFGMGVGAGMQQTLMTVQTVLPAADVPVGTAVVMFAQMLGGALFVSVAQNIFTNRLIKNLVEARIPGLNPAIVVKIGATELQAHLTAAQKGPVLEAYNDALVQTFYLATAMAAFSAVGAVWIQWKNMKGKNVSAAAHA
jgi:EmrB/QacA subfamily drug resistance transporter